MESDSYRVDILHYLNPHLIWVVVLKPTSPHTTCDEYEFEQIGLYGMLPLDPDLDMMEERVKYSIAKEWSVAAQKIMSEALCNAKECWFTPVYLDRRCSIFDKTIHKYGEILIVQKDGTKKKLSKILRKKHLGIYRDIEFHKRLISGNLKTKLDHLQTMDVIKVLEKKIKKKDKSKDLWESSIKSHTSVSHIIQNITQMKDSLTEKNLQRHNKQMEDDKDLIGYIARKTEELNLFCKDFNEVSVGRGSTRPMLKIIRESGPKTYILEKMKECKSKKITEPECENEDETGEIFQTARSKVLNVDEKDTSISVKNVLDKGNNEKIVDFQRSTPKLTCDETFSQSVNKIHSSSTIERKRVVSNDDTNKVSRHLKMKKKLPDYDKKTERLVIYGPPEVKVTDLLPKVVSKSGPIRNPVSYGLQAKNENELKKDNVWLGVDSEVNYPINSSKIIRHVEDKLTDRKDSSNESKSLNISSSNAKTSNMAEKLLLFKKIRCANLNNVSTDSDNLTNVIVTPKIDVGNQNNKDSDDETTLSQQIEKIGLNNQTPTSIKKEERALPHVTYLHTKNYVNPFKNVDVTISKFVDKLVSPILMVHTKTNCRIQPTLNLRDVCFTSEIHVALNNLSIKHPMMVQKVSWFTILRGYSLFMISPLSSGKTLGYLPAVCRLVSDQHNQEFHFSHGPFCIIVCATAKSVMNVSMLCKRLLGSSRKVLSCFAGLDEQEFLIRLLNGCDVLVSTPCALSRLMTIQNFGLDLKRLSIFVMDDCERLNDVYIDETKFILLKIKDLVRNRVNKEHDVQFIVASRIWCDFMKPLAKRAPNSVICIGAYQECVLYSKAPTSVDFLQKNDKVDAALQFLNTLDITTTKTVIVCQRDEEVEILVKKLKKEKYVVFAADSSMTVEALYNLNQKWMEYDEPVIGPVLVCCDSNLTHLNITDSHNLLHYSLPNLFSSFCRRFAVLTDHYSSMFKDDTSQENNVRIKILLEEENIEQLPKIVNFISRCSDELPEKLKEISNEITIEKDLRKAKILTPLCDFLLSFSACPDFWNCKSRHTIFKDYDKPPNWMPKSGIVTFSIIHFHNAILYSAQLKSHIQNGKVHKFPQVSKLLEPKMSLYYSNNNNIRPHGIPRVGDICTVALKINYYQRCQIIKILQLNERGNPEKVLIKLIDQEKWDTADAVQLYHLPDEFKTMPSNIVQIRLANIQPKDRDITFSYIADQYVQTLINKDDQYLRGKVLLSVGTSLVIDNLEVCLDLASVKETVVRYNIKNELMKAHALPKDDHVTKLQEILKESGLFLQQNSENEVIQKTVVPKELPKPLWAHLNKEDVSIVYIVNAENPSKFFVRLVKFQDFLDQLTKDIQKHVAKYKREETVISNKKGEFVLAKFPDNVSYYRARIDEILKDNVYQCFFVDYGCWRNIASFDIVPITENFITRLPFQAIECRLIGVKPMKEGWTEFSVNWFCDNCFIDKNDDLTMLYVKYFVKENADYTGGSKYGVAMIDKVDSKYIVVNNIMLDKNLAQPETNEILYLNDLNFEEVTRKSPEDSEDKWEKEASSYKDHHYQRKLDVVKNDANPMESLFPKMPIRSVPLVDSDNDSISSDNFDVYITKDDINKLFCKSSDSQKHKMKSLRDSDTSSTSNNSKISFELVNQKTKINDELDSDDLTSLENESKTSIDVKNVTLESKQSSASVQLNPILRPKLYWRQNRTTTTIKIEVLSVHEYTMNIGDRSIDFATTVNDSKYAFGIELYGAVKPKTCQHEAKSLYVVVKLQKLIPRLWMTLTRDVEKKNWIVYEPDGIEASSDEETALSACKNELRKYVEDNYAESDHDTEDDFMRDPSNKYQFDYD